MNEHLRTSRLLFILIAVSLSILLSCSNDNIGVFYSLEKEVKAKDNSLPNSVRTSGGMFKYAALNRFYIGTGSVFYRDSTSDTSTWIKIKNPISEGIVTGLALVGTDIFVSVTNGASHGLYRLDPATNYSSYITSVNYFSAKQVTRLFSLNGLLFAQTGTALDDNYELFVFNGTQMIPTGIDTYVIVGGAWDGTNYWFISSANHIFRHNSSTGWNTTTDLVTPAELSVHSKFSDIFVDPDISSTIYICSRTGYIYRSTDSGATWTVSDSHDYAFYSIGKVNGMIVLGAGSTGIVELGSGNDIDNISNPGGNYDEIPDLYDSTVLRIFVFDKLVFAATAANGVWRGDYTSSMTSPVWSQE